MLDGIDIIDGHVHVFQRHRFEDLLADLKYTGVRQFNVIAGDGAVVVMPALW